MLYPIKNREDLEKLEELTSSQNQLDEFRLRDKLGKQNYQEDMKKVLEQLTDTIKNASVDLAKTMLLTAKENKHAFSDWNENFYRIDEW